jgi:hypothetical protein
MPWQFEPTKDAAAGDTPRGGGKQPLIRGCPNGETYAAEGGMTSCRGGMKIGNHAKWNISVACGKEKKLLNNFLTVNFWLLTFNRFG